MITSKLVRADMPKFLALSCAFFTLFCATPPTTDAKSSTFDRPLAVMIFDKNCKTWCAQVRPVVADLQKEYGEQVEFAEIDVTQDVLKEAKDKAKEHGIEHLLPDVIGLVPLVLICGRNRNDFAEEVGPKTKDVYEKHLKKFLSK